MIQTLINFVCQTADTIEVVANLAIILSVVFFVYRRMWVSINLSCGSFEIQRKDIDASNLTNVVSETFYQGGRLPNDVREEVIKLTNPTIRRVVKH